MNTFCPSPCNMSTSGPNSFSSVIVAENKRGLVAVIPDIKCKSPKDGMLLRGRNPVEAAGQLVSCGAPLLSVVTESTHFKGSKKLLSDIAQAVSVPILRKDFITTSSMLEESVALGAAAVLLICAIMDKATLRALYSQAIELGLEPLVEVHTLPEMELAKEMGARLVGINNRDIKLLEKDGGGIARTCELASHAPQDAILVSESGILTPKDVRAVASLGAHAVLVGTALWHSPDMAATYTSLQVKREGNSCGQR